MKRIYFDTVTDGLDSQHDMLMKGIRLWIFGRGFAVGWVFRGFRHVPRKWFDYTRGTLSLWRLRIGTRRQ